MFYHRQFTAGLNLVQMISGLHMDFECNLAHWFKNCISMSGVENHLIGQLPCCVAAAMVTLADRSCINRTSLAGG